MLFAHEEFFYALERVVSFPDPPMTQYMTLPNSLVPNNFVLYSSDVPFEMRAPYWIKGDTFLCVMLLIITDCSHAPLYTPLRSDTDYTHNLPRSSPDSSLVEPVLLLRMRSKTSACPTLLKRAPPCQESLLSSLIRFTATWNCLSRSFIKSSNVLIFCCARPSSTRSSDFRRSPCPVAI